MLSTNAARSLEGGVSDTTEQGRPAGTALGIQVPLPPPGRSSAEIRGILSKLKLMAEAYAPHPDLKIQAGTGCGWACGLSDEALSICDKAAKGDISLDSVPDDVFRPRKILVDLNDIKSWPEKRIVGVQTHEIGHAKHTNYRLFMAGQAQAFKEGNLPSSWAGLWNALEDPWINNREMGESDPRRAALEELYAHWVEKHQKGVERAPLLNQLGLNAIHHWSTGRNIPTITDKRVLDAWEKIRGAAERYFTGGSSQENHELFQREVWPIAKELEERSKQDSLLNDLKRRLGGGGGQGQQSGQQQSGQQNGQQSGQQGGGGSQASSTPQSGQSSQGGNGDPSSSGGSRGGQNKEQSQDGDSGEPKGFFRKLKEKIFGDPEKEKNNELTKAAKDAAGKAGGFKPDTDPKSDRSEGGLTQEERKQLQEILSKLSPEAREELKKRAKEAIDKAQSEFQNETFGSPTPLKKDKKDGVYKPTPRDIPGSKDEKSLDEAIAELEKELTKAQSREDAEAAEQNAERARQLAKEIRERDMRNAGFDPNQADEQELYDKYKALEQSTLSYVSPFIKSLAPLLPKERELRFEGMHYSGSRVDFREIPRRVPVKDYKIHQRPTLEESPRPQMYIELLIDNSGSMSGQKMEETLKAAIFWAKVLKTFEIPFAIKLFGTSVISIKELHQDFDDPRERIKPHLLRNATASMEGTDIGTPLKVAYDEMIAERRRFKDSLGAIFVLSDSGANSGLTGAALKSLVEEIQRSFMVSNFILTTDSGEVAGAREIFGERDVVAPSDFTQLCPESIRVLRGTLDDFRRRLRL